MANETQNNPYSYYHLDAFPFPTTRQVQESLYVLLEDEVENIGSFQLKNTFFPEETTIAAEIEVFAEDAGVNGGMTYFHAPNSEPRFYNEKGGVAQKISWSGAHFMEVIGKWTETEILLLANLNEQSRTRTITEKVTQSLLSGAKRIARREEWLCAEILTKGKIEVTANMPDNPEGLAYTVDMRIKDPTLTLTTDQKWDHTDISGNFTADIAGYFMDLIEECDNDPENQGRWVPTHLLMNKYTFRKMVKNDVIYKKYMQRTLMGHEGRIEIRDIDPRFYEEQFASIFRSLTGLEIIVYDERYRGSDLQLTKFIPDGHVTVIYNGAENFGKFTYTGHVHSENNKMGVGTGRFIFTENLMSKRSPSYSIYHGFYGLPRLTEYERNFWNRRLKFMQVLQ